MTELIKQRFTYGTNSEIPSLWASMGYTYGKCSRQLFYANRDGVNAFTSKEKDAMETGKDTHDIVERWFVNTYPDASIEPEVKRSFYIRLHTGELFVIGAKADLLVHWHPNLQPSHNQSLIEIKYLYGRKAYYQTLIEKLVFATKQDPQIGVSCFQYGNLNKPQFHNQLLIPLKADLNMAKVYAGRIITSLYHMPPRFPNARYAHPTCSHCMFREECYGQTLDTTVGDSVIAEIDGWERFKRLSQSYIEDVSNALNKQSDVTNT